MDTKFYGVPFALLGDRAAVPVVTQPDGSVNFTDGYGVDYALDPAVDPDAILIERTKFNQIIYDITASLAAVQIDFPQWVAAVDNGGISVAYNNKAVVRYTDGLLWQSIAAANTSTPGTDPLKWIIFQSDYALTSALNAEIARALAAEALKAPIDSPLFTGNPQAPTQLAGTAGNFLATCAFVATAVAAETARALAAEASLAPIASPTFTGTVTVPNSSAGDSSARAANTAFVTPAIATALATALAAVSAEVSRAMAAEALLAPSASPTLTGTVSVPNSTALDSTTRAANTAFVTAAVAVEVARAMAAEALKAPILDPTLTGTPRAPTPAGGSNDTQIATTAWVRALLGNTFQPAAPGYVIIGSFILQWTIGPYETVGQGSRVLSWALAYPTACLVAIASCDLGSVSNNADIWYQTVGWNVNNVTVQRQRNDDFQSRAVVWSIGY